MNDAPDNLDDLSKVLDENIRRRNAAMQGIQVSIGGINFIIPFPIVVVDKCGDCGKPSSQANQTCGCPCHVDDSHA